MVGRLDVVNASLAQSGHARDGAVQRDYWRTILGYKMNVQVEGHQ